MSEVDDAGDTEQLLNEVRAAHPGKGKYLPLDRYRDFRSVFGSEQGKRVLHEILAWGHINQSSAQVGHFDPYKTMFHDGQRSMGIKIMMTMNVEPQTEQPDKANSTAPKE